MVSIFYKNGAIESMDILNFLFGFSSKDGIIGTRGILTAVKQQHETANQQLKGGFHAKYMECSSDINLPLGGMFYTGRTTYRSSL